MGSNSLEHGNAVQGFESPKTFPSLRGSPWLERSDYGITGITVTYPDYGDIPVFTFFASVGAGAPPFGLWLASALARRDGATEAAADRVLERVIAERAADQLAASQRRERGVVGASKTIAIASAGGSEAGARFCFPFYRISAMVILSVRRGRRSAAH